MTAPIAMDHDVIHDSFAVWHERESSFDEQLADSLAALDAYQSHLDAWQRELAAQRQALDDEREQLDQDRGAAKDHAAELQKVSTELSEARAQIGSLSKALLDRTEELRQLDAKRAELTTELELARAREQGQAAKSDQQRPDSLPPQWAEELKHLRELFERQMEPADIEAAWHEQLDDPPAELDATENPVLGSIVEQFGKLRQQRAQGQRNRKKTG